MTITNNSSYSITITSYNASGSNLGSWSISSGRSITINVPSNTDYFLITAPYPENVTWTSSKSGKTYRVSEDNEIQDSGGSFPNVTINNYGSVCDSSCDSSCYTDCDSSCYTDCDSSCDNTLFNFPICLYMQDVNIPYVQSIINNGSVNINEYVEGNNSGILHIIPYNSSVWFQAFPRRGYKFGNWVIRYTRSDGTSQVDKTQTNASITISITGAEASLYSKIEIRPVAGDLKQNCWIRVYCNHIGVSEVTIKSPVYQNIKYSTSSSNYASFGLFIDEILTVTPTLNSSSGYTNLVYDIEKLDSNNKIIEKLTDQTSLNIDTNDITICAYINIYPKGLKKVAGGKIHIFSNGAWKQATPYIFSNGTWKQATPYIFLNGTWK